VSVRSEGVGQHGLVVTATFRGNIEKALGRGNLKKSLVVLVLHPASGGGSPTGLLTEGAGVVGTTLQRSPAAQMGVVRDGKSLRFFLGGSSTALVGRVRVRTFVAPPAGALAMRAVAMRGVKPQPVPIAAWAKLIGGIPQDELPIKQATDLDEADADCLLLKELEADLDKSSFRAQARQRQLQQLDGYLVKAIDDLKDVESGVVPKGLAKIIDAVTAQAQQLLGLPSVESLDIEARALLAELKADLRTTRQAIARNDAVIKDAAGLAKGVRSLSFDFCEIDAVFRQAARTTTYSYKGTRDVLRPNWRLDPPANDTGCNNRGQLTGTSREFEWYHGNDVCDHAKEDERGHGGTIHLTLRDGLWTCLMAYEGTITGTGDDFDPSNDCLPND
jgi:hypothetical protein